MSNPDPIFGTTGEMREIVQLSLDRIHPDPNQPRQAINQEKLEELAGSIEAHGLLQPITVRKALGSDLYIVVAGERRFRAHQHLKRDRIDAIIIRDIDEKTAYELALIENLQREDLSPFDEAAGYQRLMNEYGYTQENVAEKVGKARTTVTKTLSLTRLPERIRTEHEANNQVSKSLLLEIASLGSESEQFSLWEKIKRGATVKSARQEKQRKAPKVEQPAEPSEQKKQLVETVKLGRDFAKRVARVNADTLRGNARELTALEKIAEQVNQAVVTARQETAMEKAVAE